MNDYTQFIEKESLPNWTVTRILRLAIPVLFLGSIIGFILMLEVFFILGKINSPAIEWLILTVTILIISIILFKIINYYRTRPGEHLRRITVDKDGLHYHYLDGSKKSIFYVDLMHAPNQITDDVYCSKASAEVNSDLCIYISNEFEEECRTKALFVGGDLAFYPVMKNVAAIRAHFIKGIHIFRSDLSIEKEVLNTYLIDKETFDFKKTEANTYLAYFIFFIVGLFITMLVIVVSL